MQRWVFASAPGACAALVITAALLSAPAMAQDGAIKLFDAADAAPTGDEALPPCPPSDAKGPRNKRGKRSKKQKKCRPAPSLVIEGADGEVRSGGGGVGFGGVVRVPFIRRGQALFAKVQVQGRDAVMLVDTGASFTTLTPAFASAAGVMPGPDAPMATLSTANGQVRAPFGLIPSLRFGERAHGNVTFTICPTCGSGRLGSLPIVGLLGMNVLGRYRMTVNNDDSVLELSPGMSYGDRWRDIGPWVRLESDLQVYKFKGNTPTLTAKTILTNSARARLDDVRIRYQCVHADGRATTVESASTSVPARGKKAVLTRFTAPSLCARLGAEVISASW